MKCYPRPNLRVGRWQTKTRGRRERQKRGSDEDKGDDRDKYADDKEGIYGVSGA